MILNKKSLATLRFLSEAGLADTSKLHCQLRTFSGKFGESQKYVVIPVEKQGYTSIDKISEAGNSITKYEYNDLVQNGIIDKDLVLEAVKSKDINIRPLDPATDKGINVPTYIVDIPCQAANELDAVLSGDSKSNSSSDELDKTIIDSPEEEVDDGGAFA